MTLEMEAFHEWMFELVVYAKSVCGDDITEWYSFDSEHYADIYEFGYSPQNAWQEEMSYWDEE